MWKHVPFGRVFSSCIVAACGRASERAWGEGTLFLCIGILRQLACAQGRTTVNKYLKYSIEYAAQRSYLDDLFKVYPTLPNGLRDVDTTVWDQVESAFHHKNNVKLVENMLKMDLFPIKDAYVAYLRHDADALLRNPRTVDRIAGRIYEMGLTEVYKCATAPKETNRQMGSCFKNWVMQGVLGLRNLNISEFLKDKRIDAVLNASDAQMQDFAARFLNYKREKGLDFVARIGGRYVIGEAKFLSDFGGHQNAQFADAISTLTAPNVNAIQVAILDGVLFIPGGNKLYRTITQEHAERNIMSALVLREFLYEL